MKVYMITEKEMTALRDRLEFTALRQKNGRGIHDPKKQDIDDMYRWFNYEVCSWISDVSKS